jgi:Major Facilitator Superfamily
MTIGGAALAGLIVAGAGPGTALAVNAGMYAVAALAFTRVRVPAAVRKDGSGTSMLGDLVEGWQEFRNLRWLWTTVVLFSLVNAAVAVGIETLGPVVAKQDLDGAQSWGVIVAAQGVGLVAGALIASQWKPVQPLRTGWIAVFAAVPAFAALAVPSTTAVVAVAAVLAGIGIELFGLNWDTLMQREIPADRLSRMYSYDALGSNAAIPLGQMALAPGLALLGVEGVLWLAGGLVTAMAIIGLLTGRIPPASDAPLPSGDRPVARAASEEAGSA